MVQTEKMSAVGMMAAGVAHELLNPMMGMLNFAQYCLKHTAEDDRRYPVLQDIERETGRCADIVRDLMTFSHVEKEGEEEYRLESLATIIDRAVNLLRYRIEKDHVLLTRYIAEDTPEIWLAVNGMQQVLLNLVSNALDALAESQKKEIHLEVHWEGDFVRLAVTDSGCGLTPEIMEKIYEPFFTTKPVGRGTGLGLTISRNIINSLGGDIACQSQPGVGTTFTIILPLERKGGTK
ncbi:MAG: HAMP domain-containing histidine kinase, partial [Chloroflexi bacterium]|nr:HAMP domain-containing histidine kinase [Chloroflexota bacterium]